MISGVPIGIAFLALAAFSHFRGHRLFWRGVWIVSALVAFFGTAIVATLAGLTKDTATTVVEALWRGLLSIVNALAHH